MNKEIFYNINKIIERDSKVTTYKFALLRGVIEIIQDNSPFISKEGDRVKFPTGLLIEKWLIYYYPILESKNNIPQIFGNNNLAFESEFRIIIDAYRKRGGFSAFYNDLKTKGIQNEYHEHFISLIKSLRDTITNMPMKYIGRSICNEYYSIFNKESIGRISKNETLDREFLINNFGIFSIPTEYYEAFSILGSFINGYDSILFKWADFSIRASNKNLSFEKIINEILKSPIDEREIRESKRIYLEIIKNNGEVCCVWTGTPISKYDIDHLVPFSIWKNNDLWNLLPSQPQINNKKRDKIPSIALIEKQKELIFHYWDLISKKQEERFMKEIQISLIGHSASKNWAILALNRLKESCNYLINKRGYEEWKI